MSSDQPHVKRLWIVRLVSAAIAVLIGLATADGTACPAGHFGGSRSLARELLRGVSQELSPPPIARDVFRPV